MEMDPSAADAAAKALAYVKAVDAYRKAVGTVASVPAYAVLVHGMARELLPHDLVAAARWAQVCATTPSSTIIVGWMLLAEDNEGQVGLYVEVMIIHFR